MKAQVCPVCHGKTTVDPGFYPDAPHGRQKCRTCNGRGIVFVSDGKSSPPSPFYPVPWPWPDRSPWKPHRPYEPDYWRTDNWQTSELARV
jgi:hypothetical protein